MSTENTITILTFEEFKGKNMYGYKNAEGKKEYQMPVPVINGYYTFKSDKDNPKDAIEDFYAQYLEYMEVHKDDCKGTPEPVYAEYGAEIALTGENIEVFGYQTRNFDICPTAVSNFQEAILILLNSSENKKEMLARCAECIDGIFEIEKQIPTGITESVNEAVLLTIKASYFNYGTGILINMFDILPIHTSNIVKHIANYEIKEHVSSFEKGGRINSFIRFTKNDYEKLVSDHPSYPFYSIKEGVKQKIKRESDDSIVGTWNSKTLKLSINKNADDLIKWLEEHSFIKNDDADKYASGGIVGYADTISEKLIGHYLPDSKPHEKFEVSRLNDEGDYLIEEDKKGDGSKIVLIYVYFGDEFEKAEKETSENYAAYIKFFEELAAKKKFTPEILTNPEDKIVVFQLRNARTTTIYEDGGKVKFKDKVNAVAEKLKGQPVPEKHQKEYGKKYSKKTATESAQKIIGAKERKEKK